MKTMCVLEAPAGATQVFFSAFFSAVLGFILIAEGLRRSVPSLELILIFGYTTMQRFA